MTRIPDEEIGSIYGDHMIECRARLLAIEKHLELSDIVSANKDLIFIAEFCYLQLRKITELISLSVLIAHNPFEDFRASKLLKAWNAGALSSMLSRLHPAAFPHSGLQSSTSNEKVFFTTPFPTTEAADRIKGIYDECGDRLHVGSLKAILKNSPDYSFEFIDQSWRYLVDLLNEHVIVLPDNAMFCCKLEYPNGKGIIL